MSTWVGMGPVIGPGSLDGFAIGVMMSGAFFMALTAPRRARRRPAVAAGASGMPTAGPRDWLSRHPFRRPGEPGISRAPRASEVPRASRVPEMSEARAFEPGAFEPGAFEAGAFEAGAFEAGAFGPNPFVPSAERLTQPDEPGAYSDTGWHLSVGDDGRAAGGHRSRHRLNQPLPGTVSPDRTPRGRTSRGSGTRGGAVPGGTRRSTGGFPDSAFPDSAFPERALPDDEFPETGFPDVEFPGEAPRDAEWLDPLPDMAPRDAGQLEPLPDVPPRDRERLEPPFPDWASREDRPFPGGASGDRGRPDVEFPDVAFPDGTFGTAKRPESRRLPRHAAPTVGLGSKVSHWMTGLFASSEAGLGRWVGSGARG